MKFENEKLGCSFEVPDRLTVRQQLEYFSLIRAARGKDEMARLWEGAKALITNWQCPALPDHQADIDTLTNPSQAQVIIWAAYTVMGHYNSLEDLPKN